MGKNGTNVFGKNAPEQEMPSVYVEERCKREKNKKVSHQTCFPRKNKKTKKKTTTTTTTKNPESSFHGKLKR